jgi:hypothetical protein
MGNSVQEMDPKKGFMKRTIYFWFSFLKDYAHTFECFLGQDHILEMETTSFRYEEGWLEGASNFLPWKERIIFLLRENGMWSHENTTVITQTDLAKLSKNEVKESKEKWMILDSMRDHLLPHL